jgi:integral membrane sensor domain MASE1
MNASYYMWWGGDSYGPMHLVPVIMILTFEAVRNYDPESQFFPGLLVFGLLGIIMGFLAKTTYGASMIAEDFRDPFFQQILPIHT